MKEKVLNQKTNSVFVLIGLVMVVIAVIVPLMNSFTVPNASASEPVDYFMGDIDYNRKIEPSDARTILRASVSLESLTGMGGNRVEMISDDVPYQAELADIDGDKIITPADARAVLRMSVQVDPLILFEREIENEPVPDDPDVTETTAEPTSDRPYIVIESGVKGDGLHACRDCGKRMGTIYIDRGDEFDLPVSTVGWEIVGGCCGQTVVDLECPYCNKMIPAYTCHTCNPDKIVPEYKAFMESDVFKAALERKLHGLTIEEALTEYTITDGKEIIYLD